MTKITDKEILELFSNPHTREQGFNLLVKRFQNTIYWQLRKILLNHDDTNDVMQEVFLKIWRYLEKFRKQSSLHTWIYKITINEAVAFIKNSKRKHNYIAIDDDNENIFAGILDDQFYKASEIETKLQKSILKLPIKQRLIFLMRYFEKMEYKEMAEILKTNINTLRASYHIAEKKIENFLRDF